MIVVRVKLLHRQHFGMKLVDDFHQAVVDGANTAHQIGGGARGADDSRLNETRRARHGFDHAIARDLQPRIDAEDALRHDAGHPC